MLALKVSRAFASAILNIRHSERAKGTVVHVCICSQCLMTREKPVARENPVTRHPLIWAHDHWADMDHKVP